MMKLDLNTLLRGRSETCTGRVQSLEFYCDKSKVDDWHWFTTPFPSLGTKSLFSTHYHYYHDQSHQYRNHQSMTATCTTSGWLARPQEKSGPLIYRHTCLMNHQKTRLTSLMVPWNPLDAPLDPLAPPCTLGQNRSFWLLKTSLIFQGISWDSDVNVLSI